MGSRTFAAGPRRFPIQMTQSHLESLESRTLLSTYSLQTLLALGGNSGLAAANPSLLVTSNDTVYGTAPRGGIDRSGSIFALVKGSSTFATLAYLTGTHGSDPVGGLVMDAAGNLYGTTVYTTTGLSGNYSRQTGVIGAGDGTIFELPKGSSTITTLATFNGTNGQSPEGTLVIDANGDLFGTTRAGGASGDGTVFELPAGSGSIVTLASFNGANGSNPFSPLLIDSAGDLFGTTPTGGTSGDGTVFEIPSGGSLTTLASFSGTDGASPSSGLVEDSGGNLYGNAASGGAGGQGDVYEIAAGSSAITAIASFAGTNGADPQGELAIDSSGDLFGTAQLNGSANDGTVFEIANGSNAITTIASFNGANGSLPQGLAADGNGNYFALTTAGGTYELGSIDRVLLGGTANTPGNFSLVEGRTTVPPVVVGGEVLDDTLTVAMTDVLPVNGGITLRLYVSSDDAIDSSATFVRTYIAPENIKAGVQFAVNFPILSLPTTLPTGFYRMLVQATDTVGNIATATTGPGVEIVAPAVSYDASFRQISLPAQSVSGTRTPAVATISLANDGNIPSQGPLTEQLYFSPDGTVANGTLVNAKIQLLYLDVGEQATLRVPLVQIPTGLSGEYYLVAVITGSTGATATITSASTYSILPGAAAIAARINSVQPGTINPDSPAMVKVSITLANSGNIPAGGAADPFTLDLSLTSPDGTQTVAVQSLKSAVIVAPGQSKTVKLTFRSSQLASVAAGTWLPTISVAAIAGSAATSATGPTPITVT